MSEQALRHFNDPRYCECGAPLMIGGPTIHLPGCKRMSPDPQAVEPPVQRCAYENCDNPTTDVQWFSRQAILHRLSMSNLRPDWTGYYFHPGCHLKWEASWRK